MSKQNTPGFGIEYEILVPAYFTLILNSDQNVEDFSVKSNVEKDFGNMDDVVVNVKMKNGQEYNFAFQLKHKQIDKKHLLPGNFEASGNFSLAKYCNAFKNLREEYKKYNFILYTNANFDDARRNEVSNFDMVENDVCSGNLFFNTSYNRKNIYKFQVNEKTQDGKEVKKEDFDEFFSQFSLYTNQLNFKNLKDNILKILQFKESCLKFIELFRKWHQGDFTNKTIDKTTLNLHLVDIFLSPFAINNYNLSDGQNKNLELFEMAVQHFDVTIIDDSLTNFKKELVENKVLECLGNSSHNSVEKQLKRYTELYKMEPTQEANSQPKEAIDKVILCLGKEYKFCDKSAKQLEKQTKLKILSYFFEKLLILDCHEISINLIYNGIKLYHQNSDQKVKFVLLGLGIDMKRISHPFDKLKNLLEVNVNLYKDIIKNSSLSLQRRKIVSLESILETCPEILEFIRVKELFQMLKSTCSIEESKRFVPLCYIPRSIAVTVVDVKTVFDYCKKAKDILVIDFGGTFENHKEILEKSLINAIEIQSNSTETKFSSDVDVVSVTEQNAIKCFKQLCQQYSNRNIHCFKTISTNSLLLVASSKQTFRLENHNFRQEYLNEENILTKCNVPVNVLCAQAGMGKTTLLTFLQNKCPSNMWTLYIDLKAFNTYLKDKHITDEILNYFINLEDQDNSFLKKIKFSFLKSRKVLFLLDGLDEIENICVDNILDFVKKLSEMGYHIWLSSRPNLQQKLENCFKTFVVKIKELTEEQQKLYVHKRLEVKYKKYEIEEIVNKIFANIANYRQILGVPLQLRIITEIFLNDRNYYHSLNENFFVLTKLYKMLFEGRYKYSVEKVDSKNPHLIPEEPENYLENYEIVALQSVFGYNVLEELNLDLRRTRRFLEKLETGKDPLGIIVEIRKINGAIFEHPTFAEYFACVFLVHNFDKARILQQRLFSRQYENLFLLFNIMLAEDSRLHLAVIYKDIEQIRKHLDNGPRLDKGGRNVLHLATIHSIPLPTLTIPKSNRFKKLAYIGTRNIHFKQVPNVVSKMLKYLVELLGADLYEEDKVFAYSSLEYSLAFHSLHFVEIVLKKYGYFENLDNILFKYFNETNIAAYSTILGYPKLLRCMLTKIDFFANYVVPYCINYSHFLLYRVKTEAMQHADKIEMCELVVDDYQSKLKKKNNLIQRIANRLSKNSRHFHHQVYSLLQYASTEPDTAAMNYLLTKDIDINFRSYFGQTSLHFAILGCCIESVSLLLNNGADVNAKDTHLQTPLHLASAIGDIKTIDLLLSKGADLEAKNLYSRSILSYAISQNHLEVANHLIEAGAECRSTELHNIFLFEGNIKMIDMLLKKGLNINTKNDKGETLLYNAVGCRFPKVNVIEFLLEKGADINMQTKYGDTVLHCALNNLYIYESIIKVLLDKINSELLYVINAEGLTVLHMAVFEGYVEIVEMLLEKEMDLNRINVNIKKCPLHCAVKNGRLDGDLLIELARKRKYWMSKMH